MSSCYPINRDYQRLIQSRIISGTLIPDGIDSLGLGPKRHKGNSDQPSKFANDAAYGKFMKFPSSGSLVMLLDTPDLVIPFSCRYTHRHSKEMLIFVVILNTPA